MSSKAGEEKELAHQRIQTKLLRRKEKLQNIISKKRLSQTYQKEEPSQIKETLQEEIEVIHEEEEKMKNQNLSGYRKHIKRRSKKRCWNCRSKYHTKKHCPYIQCYYCKKYGHMKQQCHLRRIDKVLSLIEKQEDQKIKKKKRKQKRKKIKMEKVDIYKYRLKESKFIKKEEKYLLNYQGESIGIFTEHYIPPDLEQMKARHINWKKVDIIVHNEQPIEKITLLDDFLNSCSCGKIELRKSEFISHVNTNHQGHIMKDSQLNQPIWVYGVIFESDEIEELFCRSKETLT